jgi:hypothetical protein
MANLTKKNKQHQDNKMETDNIHGFAESSYPFEDWLIIFLDPRTTGTVF